MNEMQREIDTVKSQLKKSREKAQKLLDWSLLENGEDSEITEVIQELKEGLEVQERIENVQKKLQVISSSL